MSDKPQFNPELLAQLAPEELRALDELLAATAGGNALDFILPQLPYHVCEALLYHVEHGPRPTPDLDALDLPRLVLSAIKDAMRNGVWNSTWLPLEAAEHNILLTWLDANWRTLPDVVTGHTITPPSFVLAKLRDYKPDDVATYGGIYPFARLLYPMLDWKTKDQVDLAHARRKRRHERTTRQPYLNT